MVRQIGDKVWICQTRTHAGVSVTCPDCGGTGRIRVIMHDDSEHSIDCGNCSKGYDPPTGQVTFYDCAAEINQGEITGIEVCRGSYEYRIEVLGYTTIKKAKEVFDTREEASAYGQDFIAKYKQEQLDKIQKKEKDTRTWAWNASYHRKRIKEAQRDLEYHTAKLNVAKLKAKENKDD